MKINYGYSFWVLRFEVNLNVDSECCKTKLCSIPNRRHTAEDCTALKETKENSFELLIWKG